MKKHSSEIMKLKEDGNGDGGKTAKRQQGDSKTVAERQDGSRTATGWQQGDSDGFKAAARYDCKRGARKNARFDNVSRNKVKETRAPKERRA